MGTGQQYANITNKMLAGFDDIGTRGLSYLRNLMVESNKAKWDVDGVFNTQLTLASGSAGTVQVNGTSKATDGQGHILDIAQAYSRVAAFENAVATYYVGMFFAVVPKGIRINPRTGRPQYSYWREEIAKSAAPDAVVNNGNGTITFTVDSVTEAGISNAGRKVRVYKNFPADNALTETIAVQELTVVFSGGANKITTADLMGQTSVSTTASDYTVVLMGISVSRNTDLAADPNAFFVGTVVGNGGTPTSFNITNQRILTTFTAASQITFTPYNILTNTDVQSAIQQFVDFLVTGNVGASLVKMLATQWTPRSVTSNPIAANPSTGGIGTVADGTFSGGSGIQVALDSINKVLQWRRAVNATISNPGGGIETDIQASNLDAANTDGVYFVRGTGFFMNLLLNSRTSNTAAQFQGEQLDGSWSGAGTTISPNGAAIANWGFWKKFVFSSKNASTTAYFRFNNSTNYATDVQDFFGESGQMEVQLEKGPWRFSQGVIDQSTSNNRALAFGLNLKAPASSSTNPHGVFENIVFVGPNTGQTSPTAAGGVSIEAAFSSSDSRWRPLVFRDCVFILSESNWAGLNALYCLANNYKVTFDNCHFFDSVSGTPGACLFAANAEVVLNKCFFYANNGQALRLPGTGGHVRDCYIIAGTTTNVTAPQLVFATGQASLPLYIDNLVVFANTSCARNATLQSPMIEIGSAGSNNDGRVSVNGLYVRYAGGSNIHNAPTVLLHSDNNGQMAHHFHRNIYVDFAGLAPGTNAFNGAGVIVIGDATSDTYGSMVVHGVGLNNIAQSASDGTLSLITLVKIVSAEVHNLHITAGGTTQTARWKSYVELGSHGQVIGGSIKRKTTITPAALQGFLYLSGAHAKAERFCVDATNFLNSGTGGMIQMAGQFSRLRDCEFIGANTTPGYILDVSANDCHITGSRFETTTGSQEPVRIATGTKRGNFSHNNILWTSSAARHAILLAGTETIVTANILKDASNSGSFNVNNTGGGTNQVANNVVAIT